MEVERKQVRKNETFLKYSKNSQHCYHPLGITILSFAEDDKLRPGEDVTSATGMTKISIKNSKCAMSKQKKKDGRPSRYKKHEEKRKHAESEQEKSTCEKVAEKDEELPEDEETSAERLSECCAISLGSQQYLQSLARGKIWMMD